jgi:hypothetical protein
MIVLREFKPEDAVMIELQHAQLEPKSDVSPQALADSGPAVTVVDIHDRILMCVGKVKMWDNRWTVWAMLSKHAGPHMMKLTRIAKRLLDEQKGSGRHEAVVDSSFLNGHRWAFMLDFYHECTAIAYLPNGKDADIYVRHL